MLRAWHSVSLPIRVFKELGQQWRVNEYTKNVLMNKESAAAQTDYFL